MTEMKLGPRPRALVIVAHPDDEVIWMGGLLLAQKDWRWTVLSLSRASDTDRAPKFRRVSRHLGVKGAILDLPDDWEGDASPLIPKIKRTIAAKYGPRAFDLIFTHGANGEYGHPLHKAVHQAVKELCAAGELFPRYLLYFNYKKNGRRIVAKKDSSLLVPPDKNTFHEKKRIVAEMYGYPWEGIDVNLCTDPEAFKIIEIK